MKVDTIVRTVLLVLALINQVLTATGHSVIPVEDETVSQLITAGFTAITAIVAWWKNNSVTRAAQQADRYLATLKSGEGLGE